MILKPGDVVLFKDELTPQVEAKLKEWYIPKSKFNELKGTCQIVKDVYNRYPYEDTVTIKSSLYYWPIQLFEEDNEF